MRTLYEALGLPPGADEQQIRGAYRTLARRFHPDVNAGDAAGAKRLAEINHAYTTLGNPQARAAYDRDLAGQRAEIRRRFLMMVASGGVTFVVTTGVVLFILARDTEAPSHASAPAARTGDATVTLAQSLMPDAGPTHDAVGPARPPPRAGAVGWTTYRDARFDFALRYPAGIFAFDAAKSDAHVHTLVSRDRQAILRIVAAKNPAGITLRGYRSVLMNERYAGASFKPAPRRRHWFVLSGTLGDEVFLERVTFACDGKWMHGWQIRYPSSQRATYDDLAKLILRNHPHGNGPGAGCGDARPKPRAKRLRRKRS